MVFDVVLYETSPKLLYFWIFWLWCIPMALSSVAYIFLPMIDYLISRSHRWKGCTREIGIQLTRRNTGSRVLNLAQSLGIRLIFQPPSSLEYNPIELASNTIKSVIRSCRPRTWSNLEEVYLQAWESIPVDHINNWFRHCGLSVDYRFQYLCVSL